MTSRCAAPTAHRLFEIKGCLSMNSSSITRLPKRLADVSLPTKLTLTFFILCVGVGYLVAVFKIQVWHSDADGDPAMTIDDIRAVYHGMEKEVTETMRETLKSEMHQQVEPGGEMRRFLERGGPSHIRTLITWLENGAKESEFTQAGLVEPNDPSPQAVIGAQCVECHHADGGEMEDTPYAPSADAEPKFALVADVATPPIGPEVTETKTITISPISFRELVHVTHAHILSIPVFTLCISALFLFTGLPHSIKLVLAPLPMAATCLDFASWWLARVWEPAVYLVAAAGAIFGIAYGLQILCVFFSMWFGRKTHD
jgi:hypothetical protein